MYYIALFFWGAMQSFSVLDKRGFSIIEVLAGIAIMGIVIVYSTRWQVLNMRATKSASIRQNVIDIKRTITTSLSCEKTFESFGAARPIACSGAVTLKDKNGNPLTNNGKIDDWTVEASCESLGSPAANGLSIYATKPGKSDPLRGIALDRNHPVATLFSPELRLCRDYFIATPSGQAGVSPKGKCKSFASPWHRNSAIVSADGYWRTAKFVCPTEFPLITSVSSQGGCNSYLQSSSFEYSNGASYLNTAVCNNLFLWESVIIADKQAAINQCIALYGPTIDPGLATCFYNCCDL